MINLALLQSEFINFAANQAISSRIADWAYWVTADMLGENDYPWNKKTATFTTTSGTSEYILDHRVSGCKIESMFDETNNHEIHECDLVDFYREDPTPTDTGTPDRWAFVTQSEVQYIVTAAGVAKCFSSSASDTNIKLVVRGKVNGVERIEELTLNGTNLVTGSLTFDAGEVESAILASVTAGYIDVLQGVNYLAQIPPGYLRVQCPRIRLKNVPGGTYTIRYFYYQNAKKLSNAADIIDIPNEGFRCLLKGIEAIAHRNNGDIDYARNCEQEYEALKQKFYNWSVRGLNKKEIKGYTTTDGILARIPHNPTITQLTA